MRRSLQLTRSGLLLARSSFYASASASSSSSPAFALDASFLSKYAKLRPPFGFNGLGELVYLRTYSRNKGDRKEQWYETVERVVQGTFQMQIDWLYSSGKSCDEQQMLKLKRDSEEMFDRIFHMKMLPPGRGLWAMGTSLTTDRKLYAALNNCAFVSTHDLDRDPIEPFCFLMDASMLGVGVGFDTNGAGKVRIQNVIESTNIKENKVFVVPDSREGWVQSLRLLLQSFLIPPSPSLSSSSPLSKSLTNTLPVFDYSQIRAAGEPISGFGGVSSGPSILKELHDTLISVLMPCAGHAISITNIVDIMNIIGKCVVAGNVRRTAEIAFGDPDSEEYISLKDYEKNPHRQSYSWTSNNSVYARIGMDYSKACEKVRLNGEPGFAWLDNMQKYGRMLDPPNNKDYRARGGNPCLEQTLESYEICCLVETFPDKHENVEDFKKTLELAVMYAKTVTLGPTHWPQTNNVMLRNRRIGTSLSGIAQFINNRGIEELREWCEQGYQKVQETDKDLSGFFGIPESIKTTCVKPSGTVSLLAGATAGMHYPESRFYTRRVRISTSSDLVAKLELAGYDIEPCKGDEENTRVVSIPIDAGEGIKTVKEVSMWEQLSLAAFLQRYWADNQVSCTVTFDPKTEGSYIKDALNYFQYSLKGISFLPRLEYGAYPQMPYEAITEEQYNVANAKIVAATLETGIGGDTFNFSSAEASELNEVPDKFCDSDKGCSIDTEIAKNTSTSK